MIHLFKEIQFIKKGNSVYFLKKINFASSEEREDMSEGKIQSETSVKDNMNDCKECIMASSGAFLVIASYSLYNSFKLKKYKKFNLFSSAGILYLFPLLKEKPLII